MELFFPRVPVAKLLSAFYFPNVLYIDNLLLKLDHLASGIKKNHQAKEVSMWPQFTIEHCFYVSTMNPEDSHLKTSSLCQRPSLRPWPSQGPCGPQRTWWVSAPLAEPRLHEAHCSSGETLQLPPRSRWEKSPKMLATWQQVNTVLAVTAGHVEKY